MAAASNPPANTVASVVPSAATPGSRVTFAVSCASEDTASATLFGQALGLPGQIPMEPRPADGDFAITVILPQHIRACHLSPRYHVLGRYVHESRADGHQIPVQPRGAHQPRHDIDDRARRPPAWS